MQIVSLLFPSDTALLNVFYQESCASVGSFLEYCCSLVLAQDVPSVCRIEVVIATWKQNEKSE